MSDNFSNWAAIAGVLKEACTEAVTNIAKAAQTHVQDQIKANNQIRTGFMLSSVYASTPQGSDYAGGEKALPEQKPTNDTEAVVGVAANYAIFPNYGTIHQPPRPFWEPGLDATQADFDREMAGIAVKMEEAGK